MGQEAWGLRGGSPREDINGKHGEREGIIRCFQTKVAATRFTTLTMWERGKKVVTCILGRVNNMQQRGEKKNALRTVVDCQGSRRFMGGNNEKRNGRYFSGSNTGKKLTRCRGGKLSLSVRR